MKVRPFILRCAAFLLILVFSQKAGTGFFLHNLVHSTAEDNKTPQQENEKGKELNYSCSCIDDFLMPFAEAVKPDYVQSVLDISVPLTFFENNIPFHTTIFSSLRGPPVNLM